jgi:hypothetical protein
MKIIGMMIMVVMSLVSLHLHTTCPVPGLQPRGLSMEMAVMMMMVVSLDLVTGDGSCCGTEERVPQRTDG